MSDLRLVRRRIRLGDSWLQIASNGGFGWGQKSCADVFDAHQGEKVLRCLRELCIPARIEISLPLLEAA